MERKKEMNMSKRLKRIAVMADKAKCVADIGTDHGYVPIYLVMNGIAQSAIAMDINEGPLCRAKQNIVKMGVDDKVTVRLSDGLEKLNKDEADTVIIAGMGGRLTIRILDNAKEVLESVDTLILSPHSDVDMVRIYLQDNNYNIVDEEMLVDEGKYYNIIKAVHGKMLCDSEEDIKYGKILLDKKDEILYQYLINEQKKYLSISDRILSEVDSKENKIDNINNKLDVLSKAIKRYGD